MNSSTPNAPDAKAIEALSKINGAQAIVSALESMRATIEICQPTVAENEDEATIELGDSERATLTEAVSTLKTEAGRIASDRITVQYEVQRALQAMALKGRAAFLATFGNMRPVTELITTYSS